jgi:hypothetical protein
MELYAKSAYVIVEGKNSYGGDISGKPPNVILQMFRLPLPHLAQIKNHYFPT